MNNHIPVFDIQHNCDTSPITNFKIADFGNSGCTAAEFEEKHRHEYFEIIWMKNGNGVHQIDLHDHPYEGSVMFMLAPGQIHQIHPHIYSDGFVLRFLPEIFNNENDFFNYTLDTCLFDSSASCPIIQVPVHYQSQFDNLCGQLMKEFHQPQIDSQELISSYIKILITQINRLKGEKIGEGTSIHDPHYVLFRKFKMAIENNYKQEHTVRGYAKILSTNTRLLNLVSKKYSHKSAGETIQERLILEAKRRLHHEARSVKEICFDLGFEDPAYFTRFFKRHTGTAPQFFKKAS